MPSRTLDTISGAEIIAEKVCFSRACLKRSWEAKVVDTIECDARAKSASKNSK